MKLRQLCIVVIFSLVAVQAHAEDNQWPVFGGNQWHQRHSPLTQINQDTIQNLQPAWQYQSGVKATFQATPIVKDKVMYLSLPFNDVVALDAKTGQQIWR